VGNIARQQVEPVYLVVQTTYEVNIISTHSSTRIAWWTVRLYMWLFKCNESLLVYTLSH